MRISASPDSKTVCVAGRGLILASDFELAPGLMLRPNPPRHDLAEIAAGCDDNFGEYAAIVAMREEATFFLEIFDDSGAETLATKAWNALWLFHLFALSCHSPCDQLYSWSGESRVRFAVCTPHIVMRRRADDPTQVQTVQLEWSRQYMRNFDSLCRDETFERAMRSFANAHHLFGFDSRIMQIWSGIECLFKVNNEIARTVALYSALLLESASPEARFNCYTRIKKDYSFRSMVVHGTVGKKVSLEDVYNRASSLLVSLLARCVELGRVPTSEELDKAALFGFLS
jgi:hypothetical protein